MCFEQLLAVLLANEVKTRNETLDSLLGANLLHVSNGAQLRDSFNVNIHFTEFDNKRLIRF